MQPIHINQLSFRELVQGSTGEKLSMASSISDAFQLSNLLVHREIVPPNRKTAPIHRHTTKEEIFVVESGNPSLWYNGETRRLSPGDVVGFRPIDGMRMIFNDTTENAIVWTIGTNDCRDVVQFLGDAE